MSTQKNVTIPEDFRYSFSIIQEAQNQKQTNTGDLAKLP